jgi:hypothetical protein
LRTVGEPPPQLGKSFSFLADGATMQDTQVRSTESSGRWMRLLGREEFARLMGASIEAVLERRGGFGPGEARRLRWEALRSFSGLLAARTRRVRTLTKSQCMAELEARHGALLRERARNQDELEGLARELAGARDAGTSATLTPEEELALERALAADLHVLLASSEAKAALPRVLAREAERRRAALTGAVARERERIDQLERRLAKLRATQVEMEAALAELARRAAIDGGLPSIYRSVQGLAAGEGQREAKAEMLTRIFEQNLVLQEKFLTPAAPALAASAAPNAPVAARLAQQKSA